MYTYCKEVSSFFENSKYHKNYLRKKSFLKANFFSPLPPLPLYNFRHRAFNHKSGLEYITYVASFKRESRELFLRKLTLTDKFWTPIGSKTPKV